MTTIIPPPEKITLLRLSAIGDVLMLLPAVRLLKKQFPDAQIDWLVDQPIAKLLAEVNEVNIIPVSKPKTLIDYWRFKQRWKNKSVGQLLSFQTSFVSNIMMAILPAEHKTGFSLPYAREGHRLFTNTSHTLPSNLHQVEIFFELAKKFAGIELPLSIGIDDINLPVSQQAQQWASEQLQHKQWIGINPMASSIDRTWPAERYSRLMEYLQQQFPDKGIVLTGGPSTKEIEFAASIEQQSHATCLNLVGKTSLPQLAAVLKQLHLLIAPDTGPIHLAAAVGTRVLGLFAAKRAAYTGPYLQTQNCIDVYEQAAEKIMHKPASQLAWQKNIPGAEAVQLISVAQVMDKIIQLESNY